MAIRDSILPEFKHEMRSTRLMIELVTDELASWRPHEKSYSAGELALHLSNLPRWAVISVTGTSFDLDPKEGGGTPKRTWESTAKTLEIFDENVANARSLIEAASDEDLMVGWSLLNGGETIFTMPRVAVLRSFVMNHMIHHRGQLSVYMRMQDVRLPEIYGPTADSA